MHFSLKNLLLQRAKISEVVTSNDILACCPIIKPITFELDVKRNMNGAKRKEDPAELIVTGTLYEIDLEMSKEDYNVTMAMLQSNFSEKGEFETSAAAAAASSRAGKDSSKLQLPVRSKYSGSRTSLSSISSLKSLRTAMNVPERDPDAKAVEFSFTFRGLTAKIYSGETPLDKLDEVRDPDKALANFRVKVLAVDGRLLVSSAILAKAYLENCTLEDCRDGCTVEDDTRIVRLMEAKQPIGGGQKRLRMIDIDYDRDGEGNQKIEVNIYSFILVGSVSYLLEIANFFVPDTPIEVNWPGDREKADGSREVLADGGFGGSSIEGGEDGEDGQADTKLTVFVKIDEPDIFLVENIDDINSDALMLNTELQFKLWSTGDSMSMMASLSNIRCHTCRFSPAQREETLAQILQPCTLSFTISQNAGHGMRVNTNMSDLCLNVSPHSISIIQRSVQAFIDSMAVKEAAALAVEKAKDTDLSKLWAVKPFKEEEFWFLKPDESEDAFDALNTYSSSGSIVVDEQAIININNLVVRVEAGVGNNTIPLILLESSFNCDVRNWSSSRMSAIGSMNLELAYYNSTLALWEPVIEPVCHVKPSGEVHRTRWDMNITLQSNSESDFGSAFVSPSFDDVDGFLCPENLPPLMVLSLQSREVLEVTLTKTFLGVVSTLAQSFQEVNSVTKRDLPVAPFIIQNRTGKPITLLLENKGFKYYMKDDKPGRISQLDLDHGNDVHLFLFKDRSAESSEYVSPLQEQKEQAEASLRLRVAGEKGTFELPVSKADKRFFPFPFRGDEMGDNHGMVSEIKVDNGCKYITIRTIVQIKNHFDRVINIFTYDGRSEYIKLCSLQPDAHFDVPVQNVYAAPYE
jgi:vacuolar protein sorting-associated protein 13A/C